MYMHIFNAIQRVIFKFSLTVITLRGGGIGQFKTFLQDCFTNFVNSSSFLLSKYKPLSTLLSGTISQVY